MNRRARSIAVVLYSIFIPALAAAQVSMQPTPRPLVTSENEGWFLAGDPITYSGNFYYPSGAEIYFDGNEMVRTGYYLGIPLYARTTEEPYSRVYVPLAGGLMQPYERRRAGELAGTVGSTTPGYPVEIAAGAATEASPAGGIAQAAAPPTFAPFANEPATAPRANVVLPPSPATSSGAVATTGAAITSLPPRVVRGDRSVLRPKGLNAVYIEYNNRRWFSSGPAVLLDQARFTRVGDYHGFSVYRERSGSPGTIYVQLADNVTTSATPYSLHR